jgi:hypothetical protein
MNIKFHENPSSGSGADRQTERRTDRQTDMATLIGALHEYTNSPKIETHDTSYIYLLSVWVWNLVCHFTRRIQSEALYSELLMDRAWSYVKVRRRRTEEGATQLVVFISVTVVTDARTKGKGSRVARMYYINEHTWVARPQMFDRQKM